MIITSITIENFKGIGDAVTIPIRPITLLFGRNSSGKSTVLQALHYMRGLLCNSTGADTDRTDMGGDYIDLGGFYSLVHRHELNRKIRIRIELDLQFGDFINLNHTLSPVKRPRSEKLKSIWMEVVTGWDAEKAKAYVGSYSYGLNGVQWHYLTSIERSDTFPNNTDTVGSNDTQWICSEKVKQNSKHHWNIKHPFMNKGKRALEVLLGSDFGFEFNRQLNGIVRKKLRDIRYLGPLRKVPPRNFDPQKMRNESLWATGLEAWNVLGRDSIEPTENHTLIKKINYYMKDILKLGYTINRKEYLLLDTDSNITIDSKDIDNIDQLKEQVTRQIKVKLHDEENDIDLDPLDVGLGIPQIIPVLVGVADTGGLGPAYTRIFAVENPELHLHPAAQVAIGDVFIDGIQNSDLNFLIETHSEHLLLRLLRRVHETSSTRVDTKHRLTPDDLSVVYVQPTPAGAKFTPVSVTDDGDFDEPWPEGFFEERDSELFYHA